MSGGLSPEQIVQRDIWGVHEALGRIAEELSARIIALELRVKELEEGSRGA